MIELFEAHTNHVGRIVARLLRENPGQTVLVEWAERSILVYFPDGNDEVWEVALCSHVSLIDSVDRCDCHAVS